MLTLCCKKLPIRQLANSLRACTGASLPFNTVEQQRPASINARHFSITSMITDTVVGATTKKIEKSKDEKFAAMLDSMIKNKTWSMRPWKDSLKDALSGWTMYIPGVSSSAEVGELKSMNAMLDAMTDQELERPETLRMPAKERIAASSGKTVEDVAKLLHAYRQTLIVHTWLHVKKNKGEHLPSTQAEMQKMQETDPRVRPIAAKILHSGTNRMRMGGRGRRAF